MPTEFFTAGTMLTLIGGSSAVLVVSNTFQQLTNRDPRWVAFALSVLFSFIGTFQALPPDTGFRLLNGLVALINGCLLFCTATGINVAAGKPSPSVVAQSSREDPEASVKSSPLAPARSWGTRWFG